MKDGQRKQDQDNVGEPRVQSCKVEALGHMVSVDELEDIEVEEIETVAALADEKKRAPGKKCGDWVWTAETKDEGCEDRSH